MRLFYASFLAAENMSAYESLVDRLQAEVPRALRPIPAATHHLTLTFLGEIADNDVDRCLQVLDSVQDIAATSFELEPPHILYGRGQPRLICAALGDGGDQVSRLQGLLSDELRRVLPALDLRPKPPHVTLARFNRKASRQTARKVEEALSRQLDPGQTLSDDLSSVSLVKSSLTPSGPIYESLGEASLS
jgi:2'-5' RNA ligase